jgi:hypothetical protein
MDSQKYFTTKRGQKIRTGVLSTRNGSFVYTLYFLPIRDNAIIEKIADKLIARREKGKPDEPCLNASKPEIIDQITNMNVHVYGFVHSTRFPNDHASGALQIGYDGVYITDLCRHYDVIDPRKSKMSPIKVLMTLFEQLVLDELHKNKIRLMVVKNGGQRLLEIYDKYGYRQINEEVDDGVTYVVMEKTVTRANKEYLTKMSSKTSSKTRTKTLSKTKTSTKTKVSNTQTRRTKK